MAPVQPGTPVYQPVYGPGAWPLRRILIVIAGVLAVLAAFAFGGDSLGDIPAWTWLAAAFAAWFFSWAV